MIPGFRRLDDGTLVEPRSLLPPGPEPPWLDRVTDDGHTHRERLAAAEAIVARIVGGWRPDETDLDDAPLLDRWIPLVADDAGVLIGEVVRHPVLHGVRRRIATSMLLAIGGELAWARTISRFYRLGHPLGREDDA